MASGHVLCSPERINRMPPEESVNSAIGDKLWQKLWRRLCARAAVPTVVDRNRLTVALNWAWSYATFQRGTRLITGISG
jgi:hypothetical protein